MSTQNRKRLGEMLVEAGYITESQLADALQDKPAQKKLGDFLIEQGFLTERQLIEVLQRQLGLTFVQLNQMKVEPSVLKLIPAELAKRIKAFPLKKEGQKLYVAMADPMDYFAVEEIRMATGLILELAIASKDELNRIIMKHYDMQESMDAALEDISGQVVEIEDTKALSSEDSAVIRLVNNIISNGVTQRASDIHFDPQEKEMIIRYRIDGVLVEERRVPKAMQNIITARVKIMGNLNITEHRVPQDGRIKITADFKVIDVRLSTLPTVYGEKVVMRILDSSAAPGDIHHLGFSPQNESMFLSMIRRPNGIMLITGPTGSGKSSTLYAALKELNSPEVNIITVEDPVEYRLDGINQIQVNEQVGMTFAAGLRSILRQDPDIIMLGEIRDKETAQIAIRASLTGHLVLSTLHTNSAVESISRLIDMGIAAYLITASLTGIVSQRLVRKICRDCNEMVEVTEEEKLFFQSYNQEVQYVHRGKGCSACNETGFRGRLAIHEILPVTSDLKNCIVKGATPDELIEIARKHGYQSIVQDGISKVLNGQTTVSEVLKVAIDN